MKNGVCEGGRGRRREVEGGKGRCDMMDTYTQNNGANGACGQDLGTT